MPEIMRNHANDITNSMIYRAFALRADIAAPGPRPSMLSAERLLDRVAFTVDAPIARPEETGWKCSADVVQPLWTGPSRYNPDHR
jgi:hypothetical protein